MRRLALTLSLALASVARADVAPPPAAPQHPAGIERAVPMGVIDGGWAYVYAAWAVALLGLALYAFSLWSRRPAQRHPGDTP